MAYQNNLKFKHNANGKLYGHYFTALRLYNPDRFKIREVYNIYLNDELLGTAQLLGTRRTMKSKINAFVAGLDAGCGAGQCKSKIDQVYSSKTNQTLGLLLFKWVRKEKGCSVDVKALKAKLKKLEEDA